MGYVAKEKQIINNLGEVVKQKLHEKNYCFDMDDINKIIDENF